MSRPKLLLADDSVTIRKVVELTFADEGIDVSTVSDAESAMLKFVEIQPDIVLVDVGLEGTSGYQICEMIKADEATKDIPVLLLVGSFEPFDQDEAERVGADGFLTKPFHSIRDLVARVGDLLGNGAAPVELGAAATTENGFEYFASENIAANAPPENEDIEDLYRNSFADTVEIDEYDTVDDMLGDPALDDEMIEATYPAGGQAKETVANIPAVDTLETAEMSKEFDWSPTSVVEEKSDEEPATGFEPKFVFDDSDELENESLPESVEATETETEQTETIPTVDPEPAMAELEKLEKPEPADDEAEPEVWPEVESPAETTPPQSAELNISPELINMLADRIVEKLSDRVIREVAQEAVPRIAEKLIREALDDKEKG